MQEGVGVGVFKVDLGGQTSRAVLPRSEEDLGVQERESFTLDLELHLNGGMVVVENVNKLPKLLLRVGPDPEDVVEISQVHERSSGALGEDIALPLCHVDVGVCGSELPHGHVVHLQVRVSIKVKVVGAHAQLEEGEVLRQAESEGLRGSAQFWLPHGGQV